MFFSRPKIDPIGWDLVALPTVNGSKNYDAITTDGRLMGFRFSSGWLTVNYSEAGGSNQFFRMDKTLLEQRIAPFGTTDLYPEQICDLLGLTVGGKRAIVPEIDNRGGGRYFDFSGKITHWTSSHMMSLFYDVDGFIEGIANAFPQIVLVQMQWDEDYKNVRRRVVDFSIESDEHMLIGLGKDKKAVRNSLEKNPYDKIEFPLLVSLGCGNKTTIPDAIKQNKNIRSDVNVVRECYISTTFQTEDAKSISLMSKLLGVIDSHFSKGVSFTNLETGEKIQRDEADLFSYSNKLKDWCFQNENRYIKVGVYPPDTIGNAEKVFFGVRPLVTIPVGSKGI